MTAHSATVDDVAHTPARPPIGAAVALRALMVLAYVALVASRMPNVFLKGRFWAEEGAVYFYHAWHDPWLMALVWVHNDYMNLTASVAAVLARYLVPLTDAPYVTTAVALLVQTLPAVLLCTSRIRWLRSPLTLGAAMLLLAAPPFSDELWLNSITSQFHLTLCAAIILASEVRGGAAGALQKAVLAWAPLSSPGSMVLAPLFILRALLDRSRARLIQSALLIAGTTVQVIIVLLHPEPGRAHRLGLTALVCVTYIDNLIAPLLGKSVAISQGVRLQAALTHHLSVTGPAVVTLVAAALLGISVWRSRDSGIIYLLVAAFAVALISYEGGMTLGHPLNMLMPGFSARYAYVPKVLVSLALLGLVSAGTPFVRPVALLLCAMLLFTGLSWYYRVDPEMANGPAWRDEVRKLAHAPDAKLDLWPSWFSVSLPPVVSPKLL